ncbi:MAG: hypothetical protein EPO68_11700, partial [Planctomycetota bacterium]
ALRAQLRGVDAHACSAPPADLCELAALCAESSVVLTADGGPRHVAQAVGARVVCVCGPTDPRHTGEHAPLASGVRGGTRVVSAYVPCGPCHRERCTRAGDDELACWRRAAPSLAGELRLALRAERGAG